MEPDRNPMFSFFMCGAVTSSSFDLFMAGQIGWGFVALIMAFIIFSFGCYFQQQRDLQIQSDLVKKLR
jgi:hypothetical protein